MWVPSALLSHSDVGHSQKVSHHFKHESRFQNLLNAAGIGKERCVLTIPRQYSLSLYVCVSSTVCVYSIVQYVCVQYSVCVTGRELQRVTAGRRESQYSLAAVTDLTDGSPSADYPLQTHTHAHTHSHTHTHTHLSRTIHQPWVSIMSAHYYTPSGT